MAPFCLWIMSSVSEGSEVEWEDVSDEDQVDSLLSNAQKTLEETKEKRSSLQITVDQNASLAKKGRKKNSLQLAMEKHERNVKQNVHKVHLLCLIFNGFMLNEQCNDQLLQSALLSLLPAHLVTTAGDKQGLLAVLQWFTSSFDSLLPHLHELQKCHDVAIPLNPVQLLVAVMRAIGLDVRLILNFDPVPFRKNALKKRKTGKTKGAASMSRESSFSEATHSNVVRNDGTTIDRKRSHSSTPSTKKSKNKRKKRPVSDEDSDASEDDRNAKYSCGPSTATAGRTRRTSSRVKKRSKGDSNTSNSSSNTSPYFKTTPSNDSDEDFEPGVSRVAGKLKRKSMEEGERNSIAKKLKVKRDSISPNSSTVEGRIVQDREVHESEDTATNIDRKAGEFCNSAIKRENQLFSSPGANKASSQLYDPTNSWIEVFGTESKKWISVHLPSKSVGHPHLVELDCPQRLLYVVGIDASSHAKDVTPRYASSWCTVERKARIGEEWVTETLSPFSRSEEDEDREDDDIHSILLSRPLPTRKQEYRGHPLYALRSLLLKYEAIYPESSAILGYCESEAVFSRDCVHTLHCRENWLKEAKVVKKRETPFKVVKSYRIKKSLGGPSSDKEVELFGDWQTEDYIPPPVVNGKVPRNEFGNIEVFKPSMVPKGGVYIRVPGIQKVARALGIDYASAVIGWEFHGRYSFPWIEGIVVAEENRSLLLDACKEQERKTEYDKQAKKTKVVLDRWVHFVKGVIIAERVRRRFNEINKHMIA